MWYVTFSKARRSGWFRQTPESLDSRENADGSSEDNECPIDSDGSSSFGASFQVEHGWVDETEWDTVDQLHVAKHWTR